MVGNNTPACSAPMWMLVNTTIFSSMEEMEGMVEAMGDHLQDLVQQQCEADLVPDCKLEEYEQTKEYLIKIDDIIEKSLFKAEDDSAQVTALLGFVDIQGLLDQRVKNLFENKLACPGEVKMIKTEYM